MNLFRIFFQVRKHYFKFHILIECIYCGLKQRMKGETALQMLNFRKLRSDQSFADENCFFRITWVRKLKQASEQYIETERLQRQKAHRGKSSLFVL